jgi:hypothetical protein
MAAPSVKQHIRMLFDWLVTGQVVPVNPARSVRGPRYSVSKGVTPVLSSEEATALLAGMDISTVVGLRDRAILAVMTYTLARVGAVIVLNVEDYYSQKKRCWLRLREKNGKLNEMPCHHKLESFLDGYSDKAGIEDDRKGPLFRAAIGKTKKLGPGRMSRKDVWCMVRRRAADVTETLRLALSTAGLNHATVQQRPRLLSDNGPSYLSAQLSAWLEGHGMAYTRGQPYHAITQGKIERYHRSLKNRILLENYYLPGQLEARLAEFVDFYNTRRYHESLRNFTPADIYFGRATILTRRQKIKHKTIELRRRLHQQTVA